MAIPGSGAELLNGGFEKPPSKKVEKGISLKLADHWTVILNSGRTKTAGELSSDAHSGKNHAVFKYQTALFCTHNATSLFLTI